MDNHLASPGLWTENSAATTLPFSFFVQQEPNINDHFIHACISFAVDCYNCFDCRGAPSAALHKRLKTHSCLCSGLPLLAQRFFTLKFCICQIFLYSQHSKKEMVIGSPSCLGIFEFLYFLAVLAGETLCQMA